jgi:hypothetical protein
MQWLRLYHDTTNDPKWRVVSVRSGQPVGNVLAVWMQMLICASEAGERGTLEGWDDEFVAAMLGYAPEIVTAIRASMQGLVIDGWHLTGWAKRQMASDTSAERTRRYRAKSAENDGGGGGDGGAARQKPNGAMNCYGDADVTSPKESVTSQGPSQTENVTSPYLRATDLQIQESNSVATATGAAAPSGPTVVPFPMDDKAKLFGPVLTALALAMPNRSPDDIRGQLAKAYHKLGAETALDLGARAAIKDDPWSWLCKSINERIKSAAGGRPAREEPEAVARLLRRREEEQANFDLRGAL